MEMESGSEAGLRSKSDLEQYRSMAIRLHEVPGVGWHSIRKAIDGELWRLGEQVEEKHFAAAGFQKAQAQAAAARMRQPLAAPGSSYMKAQERGAAVITPFDERYPRYLKGIPQPPWVLYALGQIELLQRPAIAVVGTRHPTAYGRHSAASFAEQLSARGVTVISGLARGVDGIAHEAALKGPGSTVAVLACGVDTCYPSENRQLYREIERRGLLLSETPIGAKLHPGMFPLRNRIIAGLSIGTLVVEAAVKSGSLITAHQALDMSREVFAVPGPISSPKSAGTNELIVHGAKLVSHAEHIIEEFRYRIPELLRIVRRHERSTAVEEAAAERNGTDAEERRVVELLRDSPLSVDDLHRLTGIPFGHLSALLINLCIKRKIEQQSGSFYIGL
ncbi:DNA-processing protein DprA [Paenibacillus sp. NPDC058071]|uniref:DNA-processing protein DprA n=1 Tax=Paenibacillus sp. NPDC058071 TaxID=3346326 RepID=UPI0036DACC08